MHWKKKRNVSDSYCSVHNVRCPYHGSGGDQMVLSVAPGSLPEPWVCPDAVIELAEWADEARRYQGNRDGEFAFR